MMFILRALFWLALVSAFMPSRHGTAEAGLGESAAQLTGQVVGAAMGYCTANTADCIQTARTTADVIRIPAGFVNSVRGSVPVPEPRPATL